LTGRRNWPECWREAEPTMFMGQISSWMTRLKQRKGCLKRQLKMPKIRQS